MFFFATIKVIDNNELKRRYDIALEKDNPTINHNVDLSNSKAMEIEIAGNKVVVATLPLKECIRMPGVKDGTLFQIYNLERLGKAGDAYHSAGINKRQGKALDLLMKKDLMHVSGPEEICPKVTRRNRIFSYPGYVEIINQGTELSG